MNGRSCCSAFLTGPPPVYLYFQDTQKLLRAPADLWVDVNDVLLGELKNQLGQENVALKK